MRRISIFRNMGIYLLALTLVSLGSLTGLNLRAASAETFGDYTYVFNDPPTSVTITDYTV